MKPSAFLIIQLLCFNFLTAQNVGIGTTSPDNSAKVDISSITQGFLPPRMTFARRNAIQNPATGLIIWCTDCDELQVYNGTIWKNMSGTAASGVVGFPVVKICDQVWMVKNLDVRTYANGDPIPQVADPAVWANLTIGAWCWYNNDSATYATTYGKLYNWHTVKDPRGLAPHGWHVPNDSDWITLTNCLGGESIAGGKMKSIVGWDAPNAGATNSSGFAGLPGGGRDANGMFYLIGIFGFWWSSTADSMPIARLRGLQNYNAVTQPSFADRGFGSSVRCVRD
ncbi:MAG: fibrobacter succinogenes major paralogous domain-containing protein [Ferruginibacter sp.]